MPATCVYETKIGARGEADLVHSILILISWKMWKLSVTCTMKYLDGVCCFCLQLGGFISCICLTICKKTSLNFDKGNFVKFYFHDQGGSEK